MQLDDWFSDEIPADVQALFDQFEMTVDEVRKVNDRKVGLLRDKLEKQIAVLQQRLDEEVRELQQRGEEELRTLAQDLFRKVKPLQESYLRSGKLDETLAIRDRVRQLRASVFQVRPDPGNIHASEEDRGKTFIYEVTGTEDGYVYGTDVYTADSNLGGSVVHAGILKVGEKGYVRVTFLKENHPSFEASTRHGITSHSYSSYPAFRISKV